MKILCLTSRLPYPPNRGDRSRAFNFIRQLAPDHELTLLSFISSNSEFSHIEALREFCHDVRVVRMSPWRSAMAVILNFWRPAPLQALYYRSKQMRRVVNTTLAESHFDAAYIHLFRMVQYLNKRADLYRIVDLTDVISREIARSLPYRDPLWRLVYWLEQRRIQSYECSVANSVDESWLISDQDRSTLAVSCPTAHLRVVPNGVDLEALKPIEVTEEPHRLLFVGHLGVFHNVDAAEYLARDILPRVRSEIPSCTLRIVGAEPERRVLSLAEEPGVEVPGFVTDLNLELNRATLFVAPLRFAAGVQTKVIEAMAAGRTVVTTSVVNEGIGAEPGVEILVTDDVHDTATRIIDALQNPAMRQRIGSAARSLVRRAFTWQEVVHRVKTLEREIEASKRASASS